MRSDAILKLFSVYSLSSCEPVDHVAIRFAEHLSHRYNDISSAELAFFLRVGGQLVRQRMEDLWNAADMTESRPCFIAHKSKGECNITPDSALSHRLYCETAEAMNDDRYERIRDWPALQRNDPNPGTVSRLRRISSETNTTLSGAAVTPTGVPCPLGQNAQWLRMKPPHIHSAIENEIARSHEIVASSRELIARSKELRASINLSRASRAASTAKTAATRSASTVGMWTFVICKARVWS
ncbi:hypothetical protein [Robbsia sp. KACC 23696]|uniref:hypothetical protein n=1 Tax=Robbsia sp. KACC 23696 TaxID=3149231 RepID=UPI00325B089E